MTAWVRIARIAACALTAFASASASAQGFPDRPIRIVVPYTPGAAADLSIRLMQPALEKQLGQPLVIDYKAGAGGAIAAQEVARARPDGHTLLLGATNTFVIDPYMRPRPDDPQASLVPLVKIAEVPGVLFAGKSLWARTWKDVEAKVRAPGARVNFGSPGVGTTPHLSLLLLNQTLGADIAHVPFKGSQPAIQALVGGDIQLYLGNYQPLEAFVRQDRVVPIAVVAPRRLAGLPDVPTAAEAGVPDVIANNWFALAVPRATPADVSAKLAQEIRAVLERPEVRAKYEENGFDVSGAEGARLRDALQAEATRWRQLVAKEGLVGKE